MNDECTACYGSGRFGRTLNNGCGRIPAGRCFRCEGTGKEPIDEILYVAALNRRVAARKNSAAA